MAVHNHLAQTTHETRKQDSTPIATINETALTISNQNLKIEKLENELTNVKNQLQLVESKMETLIRQNEALLLAQHQLQSQSQPSKPSQNSINSNIAQINKTDLENLLSRLTIVETEILVRKQQVRLPFCYLTWPNCSIMVKFSVQRDRESKTRTRLHFIAF